jgi:mono/diheme cytochrome c family protein
MRAAKLRIFLLLKYLPIALGAAIVVGIQPSAGDAGSSSSGSGDDYNSLVKPLVKQYCLGCHSTELKKGHLDLERFSSIKEVRKDVKSWQAVMEMLEAGQMPPKKEPKPTDQERQRLVRWVRGFLDAEAVARAGDPGDVPLRRLSNSEYDCTIRDLTGVDLHPTRQFPADGAAGEGFTNAAEALTDVSPALLNKYLTAAKDIADHAVLLPDGLRFSPAKTRRDWTDECLASIRKFYAQYTSDGRLPFQPYLLAMIRYRDDLTSGKITPAAVAEKEKLNAKYLQTLWQTLSNKETSFPLDRIRTHWQKATEKDLPALVAEISSWQAQLWKMVPVGSYRDNNTVRLVPNDPTTVESKPIKFALKPPPGQGDVVLYLAVHQLPSGGNDTNAVWFRPRLEGVNNPALLLKDYAQFGPKLEVHFPTFFADAGKYLAAAAQLAQDSKLTAEEVARQQKIDLALLKRWVDVLALETEKGRGEAPKEPKMLPAAAVELLDEKAPKNDQKPAINGWRKKGTDLPAVITNSSDQTENVPGKMPPHSVCVHPTPTEYVAVAWKSPLEGEVTVAARVVHAHPSCGNGVVWWVEYRHDDQAGILGEGALDLGGEAKFPARKLKVGKGDRVLLVIDPRDANHFCDLTQINLTITETDKPNRTWDLAADVADSVLEANPHTDKHGIRDTWSFVRGPARKPGQAPAQGPRIPAESLLGQWRVAIVDPARHEDAARLADKVQSLLTGTRPAQEKSLDRIVYDMLVSVDSPLIAGLDLSQLKNVRPKDIQYGLPKERFGKHPLDKPADDASIVVPVNTILEVRLPAALFRDREFVVDGKLDAGSSDRAVQFQVLTSAPGPDVPWDGKSELVAPPGSDAQKKLLQGFADFRTCFPTFICYPRIIPEDEVVCLKLYHREDQHLVRLFLDDEQTKRLNRLWEEHRFITQWAVTEHKNLPLFIGFVTQDQPKELVTFYEGMREPFRKRAEEFEKEVEAAGPKQLDALLTLTARAWRRPLTDKEHTELLDLYQTLRKKGMVHDEAYRGVLARVLVSPNFLFRVELAPQGKEPQNVSDRELATRLSYFLWSSLPDDELTRLAAAGQLQDPKVLEQQARRMLKDARLRSLAIEFGTQWIHVRGFDELKEKNEKLFPTFDETLRKAIYEESILFFQDLFQSDRVVTQILDADYVFVNDVLAKHYGIPGITGSEWKRVEGARKYGRGGILGLASVLTKESGASRTSPVLRGNWVVETLLGEKLPRPPKDVPRLPEEEQGNDGLSVRQLVERHTKVESCAVCHQRIDPFGFAFEKYDAIGRFREKDLNGTSLDAHARLKDGTEFDGIDGLRDYLLIKKRDVIVRLFCKKLLGYALGRSVTLSDQSFIDNMVAELKKNNGKVSAAVLAIVRSPQFRMIRGRDFADE